MNNINGINSYKSPQIMGAQQGKNVQTKQTAGPTVENSDQVEISQMARLMSQISAMPEIRTEKVETVRQAIAEGTYDAEGKLSVALDRLLDEYV